MLPIPEYGLLQLSLAIKFIVSSQSLSVLRSESGDYKVATVDVAQEMEKWAAGQCCPFGPLFHFLWVIHHSRSVLVHDLMPCRQLLSTSIPPKSTGLGKRVVLAP